MQKAHLLSPFPPNPTPSSTSHYNTHVHRNGYEHIIPSLNANDNTSAPIDPSSLPPPTEKTPLLSLHPLTLHSSRYAFWRPSSPSFRFFILALAMLIPFGPHLVKSSLSSLASYFLSSSSFPLSHTQFGSFQSALSVPNLFIPFLGGLLLDLRGSPSGTCLFLLFTLIGHSAFTISCSLHSYPSALLSRALFGLGQGSTVVAQGRIAAIYFKGHEMVFAIAVCESLHNLSALIARLYVVPIAEWSGSYIWSLWIGVAACAISMAAGCFYWWLDPHVWREEARVRAEQADINPDLEAEEALEEAEREEDGGVTRSAPSSGISFSSSTSSSHASVASLLTHPTGLPISFILLCLLHLVYSNSYHLFDYISANFIQSKYHTSVMNSAFLSSITSLFAIILCPLAGYILDHTGYKMYCVCLCSIVTTTAYLIMAFTDLTPYFPLILLSLSISFVPTILRSAVPDCTPPLLLGTAYGAYEVMESIGAVIGHVGVGLIVDVTEEYVGVLLVFAGMAAMSGVLAGVMSVYDRAVGGTLNEKSGRWERMKKEREDKERKKVRGEAEVEGEKGERLVKKGGGGKAEGRRKTESVY